jgi:hypothetical protein
MRLVKLQIHLQVTMQIQSVLISLLVHRVRPEDVSKPLEPKPVAHPFARCAKGWDSILFLTRFVLRNKMPGHDLTGVHPFRLHPKCSWD